MSKELHVIVELFKGKTFIESIVTPSKYGSYWKDCKNISNIAERLLKASVIGEDLRVLDYEHCRACMKKTLSGNTQREILEASVSVEEFTKSLGS